MTIAFRKSHVLGAIKVIFGIALLAALLFSVNLRTLLDRLTSVYLPYLAIVFLLPHVAMLLSTIKWKIFLHALSIRVPLARLFGLYMIGTFFSNFLPTMVGGDVVKSYALYREAGNASSVLAATFLERLMGLTALISILPLSFLQPSLREAIPMLGLIVCTVIGSYVVVLIFVFSPALDFTRQFTPRSSIAARIWGFLWKTHNTVRQFRKLQPQLLASYAISVAFYFVTVSSTWFAALGVGISIDFLYLAAVVPMILLAAFIPVSLNGLGVTETGYVIFFRLAGIPAEDALAIALILRTRLLITAFIGGVIFLAYKSRRRSVLKEVKPGEAEKSPIV